MKRLILLSSLVAMCLNAAPVSASSDSARCLPAQKLLAHVKEKSLLTSEIDSFVANVDKFCSLRSLSQSEKEAALTNVDLVLTGSDTAVPPEACTRLAVDSVKQLADPFSVNQGKHNTCAIAALEVRLWSKHPSTVTEVLAQVARNGHYQARDGQLVLLEEDNLLPDQEASAPSCVHRSYASQLFQLTAANVYWQRQKKDPRGMACKKGTLRYVQQGKSRMVFGDTGERLQIYWQNGVIETVCDETGRVLNQPCFSLPEVMFVSEILGHSEPDVALAGSDLGRRAIFPVVSKVSDLETHLRHCKESNAFPIVVAVDSSKGLFAANGNATPFRSGSLALSAGLQVNAAGGWHAVCVTDFDAEKQTISIDNFWGPAGDHFGPDAVSVPTLFNAIHTR